MSGSKKRILLVYVGLAIALVLVAAIVYSFGSKNSSYDSSTAACGPDNADYLDRLTEAMDPKDQEKRSQLSPIASDIKNQPGYEEDPYCQYILLVHSIYVSNSVDAKMYLEKYKQSSNEEIAGAIGAISNLPTLDSLQNNVEYLSKMAEEIKNNDPQARNQ